MKRSVRRGERVNEVEGSRQSPETRKIRETDVLKGEKGEG